MIAKVYTTPTCPWCSMVKKYLDSRNISYQEVDITMDREAAADMVSKSGQRGVPVVEIDGNIVVGFDKERIDELV